MVNGIKNIDFRFNVDYDSSSSGCFGSCDDYCRCSVITKTQINNVSISGVVEDICKKYKIEKEIDVYGLDRMLRSRKIYNPDNWEVNVVGGYYGEEIGTITMEYCAANSLESDYNAFIKLKNIKDKVEYLLNAEYGYVLDSLKKDDIVFEIRTIPFSKIYFGAENYVKRVSVEDFYTDDRYEGIRGLVKQEKFNDHNKYRVIDGHHRLVSTKEKNVRVIVANTIKSRSL